MHNTKPVVSCTRLYSILETNIVESVRSHSVRALDVTLAATAEFDAYLINSCKLVGWRFPKAVFKTALAVMDTKTEKMMNYQHLITHINQTVQE